MRSKRCKTCKWVVISQKPEVANICTHKDKKHHFCCDEKSGDGNCGVQGKNWEAKDGI